MRGYAVRRAIRVGHLAAKHLFPGATRGERWKWVKGDVRFFLQECELSYTNGQIKATKDATKLISEVTW